MFTESYLINFCHTVSKEFIDLIRKSVNDILYIFNALNLALTIPALKVNSIYNI